VTSAGSVTGASGLVGAQDLQVESRQVGRRFHAQLLDEPLPGLLVHLEGRAAPPGRQQGAHQQAGQRLAHRVGDDQALKLGDQRGLVSLTRRPQLGVDAVFQGGQPQLVEPGDRGPAEVRLGDVDQRRAAPQGERPPQDGCGCLRVLT